MTGCGAAPRVRNFIFNIGESVSDVGCRLTFERWGGLFCSQRSNTRFYIDRGSYYIDRRSGTKVVIFEVLALLVPIVLS